MRTPAAEPVLIERTVYADWISPAVEAVDPDCASVTQRLYVTTTHEGRPVEWSDDRYRPDAVSFTVHNSIGSNALVRTTAG